MKCNEKTIPSTVNHTHMKGRGGVWPTNLTREFYIFRTVHPTVHM